MTAIKTCAKCKEAKPTTGFYKCSSRLDGLLSYCKVCTTADAAQWKIKNPEKIKLASAKYRTENHEAVRIQVVNRRAREGGGKLSKGLAAKLFKLQRGKCACGCQQPLGEDFHLDHRMPLALGGSNTDDNAQLLTATCNLKKGAKHPVDFMQQRGFLL